jgi:hypothetical protein
MAMSEATVAQAMPYARELSRALWFRQADTRCRFLFAADDPDWLVIAALGPKGTQTIANAARRLQAAGRKTTSGAMPVDGDGDAVFSLAGEPGPFLHTLADWAVQRVTAIPALGALQAAGAARLPQPLGTDATIEALRVEELEVVRDSPVWQDLLRTDDAFVAAVIADRLPGERMWFWMSNDVPGDVVPLLLQPVAWHPNRDRLDAQMRRVEGAGDGVTGYAFFTDEGRLQFVSGALELSLMTELADWVRQQASACPALARLANCQFVRVDAGQALDVLEDLALWSGIVAPTAPGTLAAAAATLAALSPGASLWLWLTARTREGGFLALAPVAGDEDGAAFQAQLAGFYRRLPDSYLDAVTGTLTREPGGALRLAWHGGAPGAAAQGFAAIARREKGLQPLADAVLAGETT